MTFIAMISMTYMVRIVRTAMGKTYILIINVETSRDKDHAMKWEQVIFKILKGTTISITIMFAENWLIREEILGALTKRITYLLARITEMIFNNANNFMRMMVILTEGGFSKTSALYIKNFKHITIITGMMKKEMITFIKEKWTKIAFTINTLTMLELTITDGTCLQKSNSMLGMIKGSGTNSKWTE